MEAEIVLKTYREAVEAVLDEILPSSDAQPHKLHEAMRYSTLAPGKRLRPALCMASCKALGADPELARYAAAALELLHVFSLIHDDLPAIDNDDLRRGLPTCHRAFGEAIAILAGDALFALGFETLGRTPIDATRLAACYIELARASGSNGLVGGEVIDVQSEGAEIAPSTLELIHTRKTGALISASCEIGGRIAGGTSEQIGALSRYGLFVGLAFQITDDVLNETSTPETLGKSAGSDRARQKATYPALFGLESSRERAEALSDEAILELRRAGISSGELESLAKYAVSRLN